MIRPAATQLQLEQQADLLKERIYASLALLAVLLSLDPTRTSVAHAAELVGGTALSLWAASLVSTQLAHRVILSHRIKNPETHLQQQVRRHAPLLGSAALPLIAIGLAGLHLISLQAAVTFSIATIILALVGWSLASAKSMGASWPVTLVVGAVETAIGLAVVGLKLGIGH